MIDLTGKQKRFLRSQGRRLTARAIIGRDGLSQGVIRTLGDHLDRHELVKVRLNGPDRDTRKETAGRLARETGSVLVTIVGHTALLYRPNRDLPASRQIHLP